MLSFIALVLYSLFAKRKTKVLVLEMLDDAPTESFERQAFNGI